jgi:hypothetical protein
VTNSSGAISVSDHSIQAREVDRAALPPRPGAAESMATVPGIDTDGDLVRDDVEYSIYDLYPSDARRREILLIGAKALQMKILSGAANNVSAADSASEQSALFANCMVEIDAAKAESEYYTLLSFSVNTPGREDAYRAYEQSRSGTVQRAINPEGAACSFGR